MAGLAFGATAALGLGGCGTPERGSEASSEEWVELVTEGRTSPAPVRPYTIERLPAEKLRLAGAAKSMDDLLLTLEIALAEHDTTRLEGLMIDEREYREILYPAFPAAHSPINARFETLWLTHYPDAHRGVRQILGEYGGRDVRVLAVRFEHPDQDFVNFVLHETSHVDAEVDGVREDNLRLFGSVVRVGDQWKVLSYPDD